MQKSFLTVILSTVLVLTGCAISKTTDNNQIFSDKTEFEPTKIESLATDIASGKYVQRANNLFVLFDASSSSTEDYAGTSFKTKNNEPTKLEAQREILHRMNSTIADSASALKLADFKTSIRSFGYGDCNGYGDRYTDLHQAPALYAKDAFDKATDTIQCSHGRSNIGRVLIHTDENSSLVNNMLASDVDKSVDSDLADTKGNISLVIISDLAQGKLAGAAASILPDYFDPDLSQGDKDAIKAMRQKYGNRLCVYNVWMGSKNKSIQEGEKSGVESEVFSEQELMYSSENPADCGGPSAFSAERVAEADGMHEFMRAALLRELPPPPPVDCSQLDSDGDGVNDCDDKCPNTLKGTPVNKLGCWIVDVKFDNDRSVIKPQYYPLLDKLAVDLSTNFANLNIEVQGHTSSTASAAYNMRLSIRRATAVAEYLNKRMHGQNRLTPKGYGLTRPIDTNATAAGRANNRRVQLEVLQ